MILPPICYFCGLKIICIRLYTTALPINHSSKAVFILTIQTHDIDYAEKDFFILEFKYVYNIRGNCTLYLILDP